jgi:hypothetical protein
LAKVPFTTETGEWEMHSLVQFCTRVWLSTFGQAEKWRLRSLQVMSREFPEGKYENWLRCEKLIPHVESLARDEPEGNEDGRDWVTLVTNVAWFRQMKGGHREAEEMARAAVRVGERVFGIEESLTHAAINVLGDVLLCDGR